MSFSEGETTCKLHGGNLAVPKSDQDSQKILDIVSRHKKTCTRNSNLGNENAVWLGARKIDHKWYHLRDETSNANVLNYTKIGFDVS